MYNSTDLPKHVAFIVDGNRRWAVNNHLSIEHGHELGLFSKIYEVAQICHQMGILYSTYYMFSTENWQRDNYEIDVIMDIYVRFLNYQAPKLQKSGVRLLHMGRKNKLPGKVIDSLEIVQQNNPIDYETTAVMALDYGSKTEIVDAVNSFIDKKLESGSQEVVVTIEDIDNNLYLPSIPHPDLLVRTGNTLRISNFLLWQIAYSELVFLDLCWPALTEDDVVQAILEYSKRERRMGK